MNTAYCSIVAGPLNGAEHSTERILVPGRHYVRPKDVLADTSLTRDERKAILSSWASDACAVASYPALRRAPFAAHPVVFDEVMDALVALDEPSSEDDPTSDLQGAAPDRGMPLWPIESLA